ncbi:hypothetical protein HPB48_001458 [Haemaphysalis longicornis]|uniref:Sodium-dependent multivitamin transporter n=1 Tax=Haemaphysalis longicornis TaxID=44386 RepID=A0A9J6FF59_HAELO|nr:hypothetical protein HPB48_001458 [Haemaphysalis longicornis]
MSNVVEYAVFGGLMCANLGFGLYFSCLRRLRKEATTDEMFLGSRSLRIVPLAGSVLASMLSAIGIIGFSAHYYAYGFHYLWNFVSVPLIAVFVSKVVIPVLYELKVTSVFQASTHLHFVGPWLSEGAKLFSRGTAWHFREALLLCCMP